MNKANSQYIKATNYNFSEAIGTDPELMQRSTFMRNNAYATGFQCRIMYPDIH
ncbi:putative DNA binding protein [Microviridae phi-CA82]|uniref:putative DNA binding protein n=1 Tax=Microviridae phi-CA82 TaxID=913970 RepID=UPI000215DF7F|nr:putative DNA binding protein [Microviridae phi-CA82]ADP89816.1 putative DNA binding protein [Microviridae phi-CA82]